MEKKEPKGRTFWPFLVGCMSVVVVCGVFVAAMSMAYSIKNIRERHANSVESTSEETDTETPAKENDDYEEIVNVNEKEPRYPDIDSTKVAFFDTTRTVRPVPDNKRLSVKERLSQSRLCRYYNDRFGFTLLFPSCFKARPLPMNNDGCTFSMGRGICVTAVGGYDVAERTFFEEFKSEQRCFLDLDYGDFRGREYVLAGRIDDVIARMNTNVQYAANEEVYHWVKRVKTVSGDGLKMTASIYLYYPAKYKNDVDSLVTCLDKYNHFVKLRLKELH